jgi:hypothetical protein
VKRRGGICVWWSLTAVTGWPAVTPRAMWRRLTGSLIIWRRGLARGLWSGLTGAAALRRRR